jgi:hypothetical protein
MDITRHSCLVLGSESPNIFLFGLLWDNKTLETSGDFQKNLRTEELAESPQYGHFLTQLARFRFRVSKNLGFVLCRIIKKFWSYDPRMKKCSIKIYLGLLGIGQFTLVWLS